MTVITSKLLLMWCCYEVRLDSVGYVKPTSHISCRGTHGNDWSINIIKGYNSQNNKRICLNIVQTNVWTLWTLCTDCTMNYLCQKNQTNSRAKCLATEYVLCHRTHSYRVYRKKIWPWSTILRSQPSHSSNHHRWVPLGVQEQVQLGGAWNQP